MSPRESVRALVSKLLVSKGDAREFADGEPLLTSGRLDSIDVLDLIAFLEQEFAVDFAKRDFNQNDFDSVDEILRLIDSAKKA